MNSERKQNEPLVLRTIVVVAMILLAAAARIVPHPWNLAPVGAMALFSGAMFRDKRVAFGFPLLALLAGDAVIGFHKLMPAVYASFLVSVAIGLWLRERKTVARVAGATLLGAIQFFAVTNFAVWAVMNTYPNTAAGLVLCYIAGIPFFWNTLAGDALYSGLLFGGWALAEHLLPRLRETPLAKAAAR